MREAGIEPPLDIQVDGTLHRFHVDGDKAGARNGWYLFHLDPLAGSFGCWKRDVHIAWRGHESQALTPEQRARHEANMAEAKRHQEARSLQRPCCRACSLPHQAIPIW